MEEKSMLRGRFGLGFKHPGQSVQLLQETIQQVANHTCFEGQDTLHEMLIAMKEPLMRLLPARALHRLDIRAEDVTVRVDLQYDNAPDDADELDLSMLDLVPLKTDTLELWFFASDPQFAKYIGFGDIERLSTPQIPIFLSALEPQTTEMMDTLPTLATESLMGKNGNGNHPTGDDFNGGMKGEMEK